MDLNGATSAFSKPARAAFLAFALCWAIGLAFFTLKKSEHHEERGERLTIPCAQFDPVLGHTSQPGCSGLGGHGNLRAMLTHNSLGLRGGEPEKGLGGSTYRILFFGSSAYYGLGLADDELATFQAARSLTRKLGHKVEILNASGESYSTLQFETWLPRMLQAYSPDMVVMSLQPSNYLFHDRYLSSIARSTEVDGVVAFRWLPGPWAAIAQQFFRLAASWQFRLRFLLSEKNALRWLAEPTADSLSRMRARVTGKGILFRVLDQTSLIDDHQASGLGITDLPRDSLNFLYPNIRLSYSPVASRLREIFGTEYLRSGEPAFEPNKGAQPDQESPETLAEEITALLQGQLKTAFPQPLRAGSRARN